MPYRLTWASALCGGLVSLAGVALAGPVLQTDKITACVDAQIAANAPVADCVNTAHSQCLEFISEAPAAAIQCFRQARSDWAGLLSEQVFALRDDMQDESWTILEINARYDLTGNLVQCDRMVELMTLRTQDGELLELQKARCQATASGLAYMKLALQAQSQRQN